MASKKRAEGLKVVLTESAMKDQKGIWLYNAENYGIEHADRYLAFLDQQVMQLSKHPYYGFAVDDPPGIRMLIARKGSRGHGYRIFYSVENELLIVHGFIHTARDWHSQIQ